MHNCQAHTQNNDSEGFTAIASPEDGSSEDVSVAPWGERDHGGPVSQRLAMGDFRVLRRELSQLSRSQSHVTSKSEPGTLTRRITSRFGLQRRQTTKTEIADDAGIVAADADVVADGQAEDASTDQEGFELDKFLRNGYFEKRTTEETSAKKVGVVYKNLIVRGVATKASFTKTLPDAIIGTFGPDLYRLGCQFLPFLKSRTKVGLKDIIKDFNDVVRDGEMMLVLGKPGSGCTTFLKTLASERSSYAEIIGDVRYGGIAAKEQYERYRGEVVYNEEKDNRLPNLNVWQTLYFSLLNKTKKRNHGGIVYTTTITVTTYYRMIAAVSLTINDAVRFAGIGFSLMAIYTGYAIPKPTLLAEKIWVDHIILKSCLGILTIESLDGCTTSHLSDILSKVF